MLERIKHEKTVDIYGHVTLMRAQRNYMVQTEDQYVFIHDALQEAVNCGTTEVPARNLYAYIQKLTQIEGGENVTGMELEFKVKKKKKQDIYTIMPFQCFIPEAKFYIVAPVIMSPCIPFIIDRPLSTTLSS